MIGYRLSAIIYLLLGISTLIPGIMKPSLFALAINYSSGPLLASGIAYILIGAAENDRLGSDTYKRLNLFLSVFGILWLVAAIFIKKTDQLMHGAKIVANPLVVFASFSAVANGIKGWAYGAKGWDKAGNTTYIEDFKELVKSSWDILVSPIKNMRAGLYLAGTAYVALLKLFHLQMLFGVGRETITAARYGSWFIAFAKLQLLFMASLTLVDAAKRDRLAGATFIELNVMSAFAWIATSGKLPREEGPDCPSSLSRFALTIYYCASLSVHIWPSILGIPGHTVLIIFPFFGNELHPEETKDIQVIAKNSTTRGLIFKFYHSSPLKRTGIV